MPTFWRSMMLVILLSAVLLTKSTAFITVYHQHGWQHPLAAATLSGSTPPNFTTPAALDPIQLQPPPPPEKDAFPTEFRIELSNTVPSGASIHQSGSFMGFSVEMSVVNEVFGKNSSRIQVPFLNLISNIQQRAGTVNIRVGGNSQETAVLVEALPDSRILEKDVSKASNPTKTPALKYTPDLLWLLRNISSLVNVRWHLGIPFNNSSDFRLAIAEQGQAILGDYLIGLQVGNEPDLYVAHGHRPLTYNPSDYFAEFGQLVDAMSNDEQILNRHLLIGPNVNSGPWTPEMVWDTGFVDAYSDNLAYLAVEHYPTDNCASRTSSDVNSTKAQHLFPTYLTHMSPKSLLAPYLPSTSYALSKNKKILMFETNSASCGGFPGLSDSFGAALWGLDWGMMLAWGNFSGMLIHTGGEGGYYNPFTPPPPPSAAGSDGTTSPKYQWTIGPLYYTALVMAEALGTSNTTQIVDLNANEGNEFSPAYAIYERELLKRVLVINYVNGESDTGGKGENDLEVELVIQGGGAGGRGRSVRVKYLSADSVAQKGNITWAGQTFGKPFESDGRPIGSLDIQTFPCASNSSSSEQIIRSCKIHIPAPSAALIFLSPTGDDDDDFVFVSNAKTFPTTTATETKTVETINTVTVDENVVATSNGGSAGRRRVGSTSWGSGKRNGSFDSSDAKKSLRRVRFELAMLVSVLLVRVLGFI